MSAMKICMSGVRGHNGYVLDTIESRHDLTIAAITGDGDECDALRERLVEMGDAPSVYDTCEAMIDSEQPDVLTIAGPFHRNADLCVTAFERGIHVFCEKPIAFSLEDLDRVRTAYAQADVCFSVMMGLRYHPAFHTAWRLVRSGEIGDVRLINTRKSYKLGTRPGFYRSRATYGGTIPWVGSHAVDWIHWFSGREFRSVTAHHSTIGNRGHGELESTALCQFVMSDEVLASASLDYLRPASAATHGDDRVRVAGTNGVIEVSNGEVRLINESSDGTEPVSAECPYRIFADFVDQVAGRSTALISAEDAFTVAEAYLKAREAADSGRTIVF